MIPIFPICDSSKIYYNWNYTILCIFLNEFHDFKVKDHGFEDKETKLCFHFEKLFDRKNGQADNVNNRNTDSQNNNIEPNYSLSVFIKDIIVVKISIDILQNRNIFKREWTNFPSFMGAEGKLLKRSRIQNHIRFIKDFTTFSNSYQNLFYKRPLIYNSKYDFSEVFHFFSKHMNLNKLQINEDTQILIDFIRIWSNEKNNTISSFNDLKNTGIHGFLKLELLPIKCKKKLDISI